MEIATLGIPPNSVLPIFSISPPPGAINRAATIMKLHRLEWNLYAAVYPGFAGKFL